MRAVDIIRKKRDGHALDPTEIQWMVQGIGRGDVPDYQWSALLMAIVLKGMDGAETAALTDAMLHSGTVVDLSDIPGRKIDKHSTGGVGDKTSLILAPIAAACGVAVPMVSGRGLGHTGGTLDKLEAIPGFNVRLDLAAYRRVLGRCGLVLIGQTDEIAPADRKLYALRDATATVEAIPLLTSSILSKKLAEGIDGLVLDVKTGDGAFLPPYEQSLELATTMCDIGRRLGKQVVALITRMDQPLGRAVGNAVEIIECVECLRGDGPADLTDLSVELAAEMVLMAGEAGSLDDARARCRAVIADGSALERFRQVVAEQGGDPRALDDARLLPQARIQHRVLAPRSGVVQRIATRALGFATMRLGAGRARVDSVIDPAVGVILHRKVGDLVQAGEPLCTVLANDPALIEREAHHFQHELFHLGDEAVTVPPLIAQRL